MLLADLLEDVAKNVPRIDVSGLAIDSRRIRSGWVFLAQRGHDEHGLQYLQNALDQGAAAVVFEPTAHYPVAPKCPVPCIAVEKLSEKSGDIAARFYDYPSEKMELVGFTGTDGKTSCAHITAQAFGELGATYGLMGTIGYGLLDDLQPPTHTTPGPVLVQTWLDYIEQKGAQGVAMEVSSHALDQGRVNAVDIGIAALTNVSRDHLDYHGDIHNYARAKRRLFEMLQVHTAILNMDDDFGREWAGDLRDLDVIGYGLSDFDSEQFVRGSSVTLNNQGLAFDVQSSWGNGHLQSPLLGQFNVSNLLCVLSVLLVSGVPLETALIALSRVKTVPGRMEAFSQETLPLIVVDYAHTPNALSQALQAVRAHCAGRLHLVFGCGGERDCGKRSLMGAVAARFADDIWLTNDNPRGEDPDNIIREIRQGLPVNANVRIEQDRRNAICAAVEACKPDDVVLIAGKGHEEYQIIGGERFEFSDRALAAELVAEISS